MTLRIGTVPYLNAKPLIDWFHSGECEEDVELTFATPSVLAAKLRAGELDVANCSIFESFRNPNLSIIPDISISAYGEVKSVRLFSRVPLNDIRSVALDSSSLTSAALVQIILAELHNVEPRYKNFPPDLTEMLEICDAGLLIGDLKLFDFHDGTQEYDLGQAWLQLTGLPFVYAAWQSRDEAYSSAMSSILTKAKNWGVERLPEIAEKWSLKFRLPLERCKDYLLNVMNYDLTPDQMTGLRLFQTKCHEHGLVNELLDIKVRE